MILGAQGQDLSQVQIKVNKITNNFYALDGSGGTIGVLTGPDGVFMVDAQFAPLTDKIVAAIKTISDGRIRFLVNTHVHGDHTGGNENLGKLGVTILAREPLRTRLMKPNPGPNGQPGTPTTAPGLPTITYEGAVTFHMNGEDVRLIPVPVAHTDGDTMVFFPNNNVLMTGDFYRSVQYPNVDRANGGSLKGLIDALDLVVKTAGPNTKIVPGHGPIVDRAAVQAHRDVVVAVRDKIAPLVAKGMTVEQVTAAKPTADFDSKISQPGTTAERFIGQVYAELKK
jgi:glyoxylase-like metal-dependent hydrolase (beta-lactamase superfamily II)